jgi:DNA polymerase-3 subunit beta
LINKLNKRLSTDFHRPSSNKIKHMKFNINREQILTPLQQIVSVIEKRQTMPILSNVLMVIEEESVCLTGTDLEIQIVAKINITSATPGSITVPARKFLDICRLLPSGAEIKIEQQDDKVKILSNRSRFSLSCLPADNYPEFSESELENHFLSTPVNLKKLSIRLYFAWLIRMSAIILMVCCSISPIAK